MAAGDHVGCGYSYGVMGYYAHLLVHTHLIILVLFYCLFLFYCIRVFILYVNTGCSTVLLPDRVVQALNLNLGSVDTPPQVYSRGAASCNPDSGITRFISHILEY